MFTDQLLWDYCRQIRDVEEKMETGYRELAEKLTHPEYKRLFAGLVDQEWDHQSKIDSLMSFFTEG